MFKSVLLISVMFFSFIHMGMAKEFSFKLHSWESDCSILPCGIPQPTGRPVQVTIEIQRPLEPGSVSFKSVSFEMGEIAGDFHFYWIHPDNYPKVPDYFNIQLVLKNPARALCAMTPRADWGILPPLVCATEIDKTRHGVTLINY